MEGIGVSETGGFHHVIEQEFFRLELHRDGVLWLKRKTVFYPTYDDIHRAYRELFKAADDWVHERKRFGVRRPPLGFLYDVRTAPPPSNDPAFEQVHNDWRPEFFRRSKALVVLVKTAAGQMQMKRLGHNDGTRFFTTQSEELALTQVRALMGEDTP